MTDRHVRVFRGSGIYALLVTLAACTTPSRLPPAHVSNHSGAEFQAVNAATEGLKVVSINVAHSRSMGFHQAFQSGKTAKDNLDALVRLLNREDADVVALQEVDGPSIWSGGFDHVAYLAEHGDYPVAVRGTHMRMPGLDYGTALMSRYVLDDAESVGFGNALSINRKGFVISELQWPETPGIAIDVVSVHLDPLRSAARLRQVQKLVSVIEQRGRPVIVMGDFNDDWQDEDSAARHLTDSLGLVAYDALCEDCHTHRRMKNFVDWIFVSPGIRIEEFEILDDDVSDHYAVAATLTFPLPARDRRSAAL